MKRSTVFLFGAAEKGEIGSLVTLASLEELFEKIGHPPENSEGVSYAIQALLFQHGIIFFRVSEEGYNSDDYFCGLKLLKQRTIDRSPTAICMPGVGDQEIIQAAIPVCHMHQSILIVSEKDLYDYLTVK